MKTVYIITKDNTRKHTEKKEFTNKRMALDYFNGLVEEGAYPVAHMRKPILGIFHKTTQLNWDLVAGYGVR